MAILVRNLFFFCLFAVSCAFIALFWFLEHRLPNQDYSKVIEQLNNNQISKFEFTGNRVEFTDRDNRSFMTTVPDVNRFLEKIHDKNIRIVVKEDRFNLIYVTVVAVFVIAFFMVVWWSLRTREKEESTFVSDKLVKQKGNEAGVTFADIAGIPEALAELEEIVTALKHPENFKKIGATIPRGILLQGPPGTGKTLLAKALAGEAGVPFYSFSGSDFVEMFVGVGASRVRDLFKEAKKNSPCIVFIDEIDAVGARRSGSSSAGGQEERAQTLNALLSEMDGFDTEDTIVVLASTNRPDILDPALKRPGRFDRQVNILPPDLKGRRKILEVHSRKVAHHPDIDFGELAKETPGFTGAELANLVNEAALLAARNGREQIVREDFDKARDRILMGIERRGMVINDQDRKILAYHEAGHGVLAKSLPHTDPLHKITIVPRGMALGQTQQVPISDHPAYSKQYLRSKIIVLMGGRAAEELIFKQQTTGSQGDLLTATQLATNMVCKWGMSRNLGPQVFTVDSGGFIGGDGGRLPMANDTARIIDQEINALLAECYAEALSILRDKQILLDHLAEILLQVETLDGDEFDIIVDCSAQKESLLAEERQDRHDECAMREDCSVRQSMVEKVIDAITT
ncbi:MAG: ATP-dependent zinc metalloprotease FtsH [Desulfobulbus sp.]|jgi:cell division protease FtsH|uniref:ATP-dependent zinc metalloprotease FtsH n=1 Tax=Desulfobulbus sp. TaxID=895 RepID=UPI00284C9674|nr:ATP-dependent zinc metalloprotease FtsH [Desulfobulbus sp.]MDR2549752.1 ATP-dependent zinc metalloprotease FtsH [Desulfobulbus sp.]